MESTHTETHITVAQLDCIQEWLKYLPQFRLVVGVKGSLTCDGMAIEWDGPIHKVMHPLSFLQLCQETFAEDGKQNQ
jgi:hypothetical protein